MKNIIILIIPFLLFIQSCKWSPITDNNEIKSLYENIITYQESNPSLSSERLISNEEKAIKIAELYLFDKYGKWHIIKQRPYFIGQYRDCWVITGNYCGLHSKGGVFKIAIDSRSGEVKGMLHEE